jgi:hypothetical protein
MADRVDEDHTKAMEAGLRRLDDHIAEAEEGKEQAASKAQRAGDAIEGGPEHGGAEATLSGGGSSDEAGDAGEKPDPSQANGEIEEEQANPS